VNHTPEFHGAMEAVGVDIAGKMADYVLQLVGWSGVSFDHPTIWPSD